VTDAARCPNCGAPILPTGRFCGSCGRPTEAPAQATPAAAPAPVAAPPTAPVPPPAPVAAPPAPVAPPTPAPSFAAPSTYGQVLSPGGPPSMFGPAPQWHTGPVVPDSAKPFGILLLAAAFAVTSLVLVGVAWDYWTWAGWRLGENDILWAGIDAAFAVAYAISVVYGLVSVPRLWKLQPFAWPTANLLALAWIGLDILSIGLWGLGRMSLIGLVAAVAVWVAVNLTPTRALFGRPPLFGATPAQS
jgi:hypothetical protein